MANSTTHNSPHPIRTAKYSLPLFFFTVDGVATDPIAPDTKLSADGGATWVDATNEITTGGGNGAGYITLTSNEMNAPFLIVAAKSSNCMTAFREIRPLNLPVLQQGTLIDGGNGSAVLPIPITYNITGCYFRTTGGTGGGSGNNQVRRITSYDITSGTLLFQSLEVAVDNTTTYSILLPPDFVLGALTLEGAALDFTDEAISAIADDTAAQVIEGLGGSDIGTWTEQEKEQVLAALSLNSDYGVATGLTWVIARIDGSMRGRATISKNSTENVQVAAKFQNVLGDNDAIDEILGVALVDEGQTGTITSPAFSDLTQAQLYMNTVVKFFIAGGTAGQTDKVLLTVHTLAGNIITAVCDCFVPM